MIKIYLLVLFSVLFFQNSSAQNNYSVTSIPFQQFTGTLTSLTTGDDMNSSVINIPFTFEYFGIQYDSLIIGTNGSISFNTNNASTFSNWSYSTTIPNTGFPIRNAVLGCYHDMDNSNGQGTITYGSYGTAPFRKFVVYFDNNSQYSCTTAKSSFQMILFESQSIIDVQIMKKDICPAWNGGRAVVGLINNPGTIGITPPGRNTGQWTTTYECWRFSRPNYYYYIYNFVKCDAGLDGVEDFNLQVVQNDLSPSNPSAVSFYTTYADAQAQTNPLTSLIFTNTLNPHVILAVVNGVVTKQINLSVIDCSIDADNDSVSTDLEDINNDTNLANDDTDIDGIPNYLDNDDDGDMILTNLEYVFTPKNATLSLIDTDNDGIPNYLDKDDDGDGTLSGNEDYNHDGNPRNDDLNNNGIADYLDNTFSFSTLNNQEIEITKGEISLYPNPTSDILNIANGTNDSISNVEVYSINGALVKEVKSSENIQSISVSDLQTGIYFVKLQMNNQVLNYKFVKK